MTLHSNSVVKSNYPFLAHPPQKRRPLHPPPPLPSTPAQTTFSAVAAWAARVQPGSPATSLSPCSPHRRSSLRNGRRLSIASICTPSASFLHIAPTPTTAHVTTTPSLRDFKADLTTVGYTSVFLQLPNSPMSGALAIAVRPPSPIAAENIPTPPVPSPTSKPRGLSRFRSLSALRSRGGSKPSCPGSPTKMKAKAAAQATIVKHKKTKYPMRPPPLVNELALMQFIDGGSMEDNIKRIADAQSKATGAVGRTDVYRDGNGGIWRDQDEELEYTHLLAESGEPHLQATGDLQWVTFDGNTSPSSADMGGEERRDSVFTQDSDLDPRNIIEPTDVLDGDFALFGGAISSLVTRDNAGMSVLALPSRPRRAAKHLRKADYLVDMTFSLRTPKSPKQAGMGAGSPEPKGKARRRPAPLKLVPPSPASKLPTNSPIDSDKVRKDFIAASFKPAMSNPVVPVTVQDDVRAPLNNSRAMNRSLRNLGPKKKPSMLTMMGFFRSGRKDDMIPLN